VPILLERALPPHVAELLALLVCLGFFDFLWQGIQWLGSTLFDIGSSVATALAAVWKVIRPIFDDVWSAIRPIWDDVLKPFFLKLEAWFQVARKWFTIVTRPILNVLNAIKKLERAFYMATFGPILDTLKHLQTLITLLHLTHTGLGQALNNALTQVEVTLQSIYNQITEPINNIINVLESVILDVDGLLKKTIFTATFARDIGSVWRIWWAYSLPGLTSAGKAAFEKAAQLKTAAEWRTAFVARVTQNGSDLDDAGQWGLEVWDAVNRGEDPPTLPVDDTVE